jgi:transposase
LRKRRLKPHAVWHLDEVYLKIDRRIVYLWRAVDAEGELLSALVVEAATRLTVRFVELKSQDQLDMQTLHRSRDRLVGERTALINQLRTILLERGMVAPRQAEARAVPGRVDG